MNRANLLNSFYLVLGFLIGQGSMFIIQSWLAISGDFLTIAKVGIGLGVISLFQWLCDAGGVFLLSRKVKEKENLLEFFVVRFFLAFVIGLCSLLIIAMFFSGGFYKGLLLFLTPIGLVWSANITGVLDCLAKNKVVGPLAGLPWLISSLAIVLCDFDNEFQFGVVLGSSYLAGVVILVIVQYQQIKFSKIQQFLRNRKVGYKNVVQEIVGYSFAFALAQLYGRLLPVMVQSSLGETVTGFYVYARSVTNISGQFIAVVRRVEFSRLTSLPPKLLLIVKAQKLSILLVLLFFSGSFSFYLLCQFRLFNVNPELTSSLTIILCLQALQLMWLMPSLLGQYLIANSRVTVFGNVQVISATASLLTIYLLLDLYGLSAVYFGEGIMYLLQLFLFTRVLRS